VWPWRSEPLVDRNDVNGAIAFWMLMDAKLDEILALLRDEDEEEGSDT
jgi:hypothetical protein